MAEVPKLHAVIGAKVHFVLPNGQCRPATVTRALPETPNDPPGQADLHVKYAGVNDHGLVAFDAEASCGPQYAIPADETVFERPTWDPRPGTWHHPHPAPAK